MFKKHTIISSITLSAMLLIGCGGGSSSSSTSAAGTTLNGIAVDDLIGNGIVTVSRPDTNETLVGGRTKTDGTYSLALPAGFTGPILVKISSDANTSGMPVGMELRSVDVINSGETTHLTQVSFLSEIATSMALNTTGDLKTAIKLARQQVEIGAMTGGVPVDLSANPETDTTVKALVDTIRTSAGDGDVRKTFIQALSADLQDGNAASPQFKIVLGNIRDNQTLDSLDDDAEINSIIKSDTAYTPVIPPVVADGVAAGIVTSKTMFKDLRTQALALVDYQKTGTPGFFDTKALDVEAATRNVAAPEMGDIGNIINAMNTLDKETMASSSIGTTIDVIKVTKSSSSNFSDAYGSSYDVSILGEHNWWYDGTYSTLLESTDVPHSFSVTKTAAHSYSYIFTDANDTTKKYTGTFQWSGASVLSMNGDVPAVIWNGWTQDALGNWSPNVIRKKMAINITGSITTSGITDSISYSGTVKTYVGADLHTTFTINSAHYKIINVAATASSPAKTLAEPLDFDGKFELATYTLTGKITASNYVDADNHGETNHIPTSVTFNGKALDSTDGSYISGLITGSATAKPLFDDWLYNISFTGELNVPKRPLTKVILAWNNIDAAKANVSLTYQYDTTKITGTGIIATSGTVDGTNKYTATLKNQTGVTINLAGAADGTLSGNVLKDTTPIGTINMLTNVPRVKYSDGTFETFL